MPNFDINSARANVNAAQQRVNGIKHENYAYQVEVTKTRPKKLYSKAFGAKLHYRKTVQEPYTDIETRYREEDYKRDLKEANSQLSSAETVLTKLQNLINNIGSATDQQRSDILSGLFNQAGAEPMINTILARGIDMDFALVQSMRSNNLAFFEFLLARGANCDQAMIEDEGANITIVSYVAKHHAQLLDKTIQAAEELTNTFLAAVRAGDMDLLRNMVNLKVDLVRAILEQENMFREILAQDNAEMTELFLAHVELGAEITKLINENSEEANGYIARLVEIVDAALLDSAFVIHALNQNNLEAAFALITDANLLDVATDLIDNEQLDLLIILTEARPEILQEELIAEVLRAYQAQEAGYEDVEGVNEFLAGHDLDGADVDISGGHDFYADLD
jgi:hypothetical protein